MPSSMDRIIMLEHRARAMPRPAGAPDLSRLTAFEASTLRSLSERVDRSGWDCLTDDEIEVGVDLVCRLWDRHPDRAHESYPWPDAEHAGPVL